MGFDETIRRLKKQTEACELNILVWGTGSRTALEHFEKRNKIRDEVRKCFPNADVRFSEDLDLTQALPGLDQQNFPQQELWHLAACDVCIVLDTSQGPGEEIAFSSRSPDAHKLLILTHETYQSTTSYSAALRRNLNQLFYDDEQYSSCNLVEHVLSRVRTVALGKLTGFRV